MQWHYARQGQQFGPVDGAELRRLAQEGRISPDDLVWNHTLGDRWVPASTVPNLFAGTSSPIATGSGGMTHNRDLMRMARESLRNHWGLGVTVAIVYFAIIVGVGFIPVAGSIAQFLIAGPMALGLYLVFMMLARRSPAELGQLFQGFERFGTALVAHLFMTIFIMLWSLLLIIPGIIASLSYAMTYFIIADDPTVEALQAITRSKEMMSGHRWKLFCLYWRFFGWAILCILTMGIGYLWLAPYMQTTLAHFYDDVRPAEECRL